MPQAIEFWPLKSLSEVSGVYGESISQSALEVWGFILSHFLTLSGVCGVTPRLFLGPQPCNPFVLVVSPRLRLWQKEPKKKNYTKRRCCRNKAIEENDGNYHRLLFLLYNTTIEKGNGSSYHHLLRYNTTTKKKVMATSCRHLLHYNGITKKDDSAILLSSSFLQHHHKRRQWQQGVVTSSLQQHYTRK